MPRIARVVAPKYPHHITQRGTNKSEIFNDNKDPQYFLKLLGEWAGKTESEVWAYCLMSNHFHLLIAPDSIDGLGKCLQGVTLGTHSTPTINMVVTADFGRIVIFLVPVDRDEYLWAIVKYIEMEPVRAGVIKKAEEWRWSSAGEHIRGESDNNIKLHKWLKDEERKEYAKLMFERSQEDKEGYINWQTIV